MTSFIIKRYSLIYTFLFISLCIFAQENIKPFQYSSTNKKALKDFDEGKRYYDARKDKQAEECFLKAIEADKTFIEPHVIISILCLEQDRLKERIYHLEEAIKKGPGVTRARKEYEATAKKTSPQSYSVAPAWANLCVYFRGDFQFDGVNHDVGCFACFFNRFNAQSNLIVNLEH